MQFENAPQAGIPEELEPGLRRILAPNPSPMTYWGTNTYVLGQTDLAVIDPGPDSDAHLAAILGAVLPHQRITHIIVTHTHLDHSPLAAKLSQVSGAPICAFGDALAGRSRVMQELADRGMAGGGEGIDRDFRPDHILTDGQTIESLDWTLKVIHTPGHLGNHISLGWKDACFTADHVMGWASSLVSPPDGDLTQFMASCERLMASQWRIFYAGHGDPIADPMERLTWLVTHRLTREAQILSTLEAAPATAEQLAREIYTETPDALIPAATRNVFAHLVDLAGKNKVTASPEIGPDAIFIRI